MSKFSFGEWEAKLYENPGMISIDLWLSRRQPHGREILTHKGEIKTLRFDEMPPDKDDYFVRFEDHETLLAVANALSDFGIKTNNDHKNEGLLEATREHLQDMRRLAFKKGKK